MDFLQQAAFMTAEQHVAKEKHDRAESRRAGPGPRCGRPNSMPGHP